MTTLDPIVVPVKADATPFKREMSEMIALANGFGRTMTRAFEGAILRGRDFNDVMRSLALRLSSMAVNAAFRPIEQGLGKLLEGLLGGAARKRSCRSRAAPTAASACARRTSAARSMSP